MASGNFSDSRDDLSEDLDLSNYYTHLLNTKNGVDVTFVLQVQDGDVKFFAHKLILAMRSPFFADKFYGDQRDKKHHIIRLEKVNPKAFEEMIRYCYGCKPALGTIDEISALIRMSSQFEIKSLINLCHARLRDTDINPENVFNILEVSEYLHDENLTGICYKYLENYTAHVIAAHDLQNVTESMVQNIIDLQKLSLDSEYELIRWIFDWAKVKSEEVSAQKSAREYLEKFLKTLNFLALTSEEFAILCKEHPDFLNADEIASILLNLVFSGSRDMPSWYDKSIKLRNYFRKELDMKIVNTDKYLENLLTEVAEWKEAIFLIQECESYLFMEDCERIIRSVDSFVDTTMCVEFERYNEKNTTGKLKKLLEMLQKRDDNVQNFRKTLKEIFYDVKELDKRLKKTKFWNLLFHKMSPADRQREAENIFRREIELQKAILKEIHSAVEEKRRELNDEFEEAYKNLCLFKNRKLNCLTIRTIN